MRLTLYSSVPNATTPNLVALQDELLSALPTVLVCPLRADMEMTTLRVRIRLKGQVLVALPELVRPIRRTALRPMGLLAPEASKQVMERLQLILAQ